MNVMLIEDFSKLGPLHTLNDVPTVVRISVMGCSMNTHHRMIDARGILVSLLRE